MIENLLRQTQTYGWACALLLAASFAACSEEEVLPADGPTPSEEQGEMILFSSGTTDANIATTRADETHNNSYYMADKSRFVCRMYYKTTASGENYDVSSGTDITTWLWVNGNNGDSKYWNKYYQPVDPMLGNNGYDAYGNDYNATCLYWQNRKEHAFLVWTDLNHNQADNYVYAPHAGALKMLPADYEYKVATGGTTKEDVLIGYELCGCTEPMFTSWDALSNYIQESNNYDNIKNVQRTLDTEHPWGNEEDKVSYYQYGKQCKYLEKYATYEADATDNTIKRQGWIRYKMFFDKIAYEKTGKESELEVEENHVKIRYLLLNNEIVCRIDTENGEDKYYKTDTDGNYIYDETNPKYDFYFKRVYQNMEVENTTVYLCNMFDLTRGTGINSIDDQPDICQDLRKMEPKGGTAASNRVNLYFKHCFSQLQVNVRASQDGSVNIAAEDITKVELLGVTETGYVFSEIDKSGNLKEPTYKIVNLNAYTAEQRAQNPYGTAFDMFVMQGQAATGYLRSFNAIAFGQLQAIRVTWKEHEEGGVSHEATFKVTENNLRNLQSGYRYIWNIELRRGTLAVIRTEVVGWTVPKTAGNQYEYNEDGTITN